MDISERIRCDLPTIRLIGLSLPRVILRPGEPDWLILPHSVRNVADFLGFTACCTKNTTGALDALDSIDDKVAVLWIGALGDRDETALLEQTP